MSRPISLLGFALLIGLTTLTFAQSPPKAAVKQATGATAATALAEGRFGKALDARVASAIVRGHADLRTPPLTVSCWAKLSDKKSFNILVASETKYSSLHWEVFTVAGTGKFTAFLAGMKPDHVRSEVDICDDRWHHLAMVYEPGRVRLYVDAKEVTDQAIVAKGGIGRFEDIAIGSLTEGGLRCAGLIDEVFIARGAHPLTKLPEKAPQVDKDTVGLWRFDEQVGSAVRTDHSTAGASRPGLQSGPYGRFADASTFGRHGEPSYIARSALEVPPRVHDDRLTIELVAKEPDIVTPIGIVVDERDRLLVLESNTHFPPKGYKRHPSDRILWLRNGDEKSGERSPASDGSRASGTPVGMANKFTVFADGFTAAMHLTSHPDGSLYVVTRGSIIRLRDKDGDGVADERTTLVRLETTATYPHNGLFSVAFDWLNRMYISMGENLGADFKLVGSDGSSLSGGGEGGNIFRATAEGGKVERIATGFWNPVQLHFDVFGRLFTVDNDPDSRPPCRLLHIVPGGDYGYRYRNGRSGLHPFSAWNGELPGTLPMVAATGEAPSGLITCHFAGWPGEHFGKMLVTSWGDYRIDLFTLERRGASFRADRQPLVTGGDDFRPVAMAAGRNGEIYVTDWVDKSYEVHLKGRVWRIRPKGQPAHVASPDITDRRDRERAARFKAQRDPTRAFQNVLLGTDSVIATALGAGAGVGLDPSTMWSKNGEEPDFSPNLRELEVSLIPPDKAKLLAIARREKSSGVRATAISRLTLSRSDDDVLALVTESLAVDDPFLQCAAREALRRSPELLAKIDVLKLPKPEQQVGVLLALRTAGLPDALNDLPKFLEGPDERVRFIATQWIGEARLKQHREALLAALNRPGQSAEMFAATLMSLALVDGARNDEANGGGRVYLERMLDDAKTPLSLKARSLRRLPADSKALSFARLSEWIRSPDAALRLEAVRALSRLPDVRSKDELATLASDPSSAKELRAEAVAGLAGDDRAGTRGLLLKMTEGNDLALRHEALRSLRGQPLANEEREGLRQLVRRQESPPTGTAVRRQELPPIVALVERVLESDKPDRDPRPQITDTDAWLKLLDGPADAAAGERIFYHTKSAGCFRCHRFDGRGSDIGPDLTLTARTMDRRKLVESILQPSKEIAPQFFVWQVQTDDGRTLIGTLVKESPEGDQTYADAEGKLITVRRQDIAQKASQRRSIMPDDVIKLLTVQEFRDVLAFLRGK